MRNSKPIAALWVALFAVAVGAALFASAATAYAAAKDKDQDSRFVAGFEDLPLMLGLTQVADAGMVFDTPSGRIVEAYANGKVAARDIAAFYERTLPHLGWKKLSEHRYRREGEILDLEISKGGPAEEGSTTVRFYLAPNEQAAPN